MKEKKKRILNWKDGRKNRGKEEGCRGYKREENIEKRLNSRIFRDDEKNWRWRWGRRKEDCRWIEGNKKEENRIRKEI